MSFDSGSIVGSMLMDTGGFVAGVAGAEALAGGIEGWLTELVENPLGAVAEAATAAGEAILDAVSEAGNTAANLSLLAEKAGVTVEQFSQLAAVGSTVNISAQDLSAGFRFLDRNAAAAVDGSLPAAAQAFQSIGISVDFLRSHLGDSGAIFDAIETAISALPSAAERTRAAMLLLGRGGESLVPIFNLGKQKIDELAGVMTALGVVEDAHSASAGRSFATMEAEITAAMEGIKRAVAEPVLDSLAENADDILPQIIELAQSIGGVLRPAMELLVPVLGVIGGMVSDLANLLKPMLDDINGIIAGLKQIPGFGGDTPADAADTSFDSIGGGFRDVHVHVPAINVGDASSQIAQKIQGPLQHALRGQQRQIAAAGAHAKVARATGGKTPAPGSGGDF